MGLQFLSVFFPSPEEARDLGEGKCIQKFPHAKQFCDLQMYARTIGATNAADYLPDFGSCQLRHEPVVGVREWRRALSDH